MCDSSSWSLPIHALLLECGQMKYSGVVDADYVLDKDDRIEYRWLIIVPTHKFSRFLNITLAHKHSKMNEHLTELDFLHDIISSISCHWLRRCKIQYMTNKNKASEDRERKKECKQTIKQVR